jgi:hypothetical protein
MSNWWAFPGIFIYKFREKKVEVEVKEKTVRQWGRALEHYH